MVTKITLVALLTLLAMATLAQARARTSGKINRGAEFARAALEMAALKSKLFR